VELKFANEAARSMTTPTFNQTKVELKYLIVVDTETAEVAFNQTKVELKFSSPCSESKLAGLLIRPKWN